MRRGRGMGLGIRRGRGFTPNSLAGLTVWLEGGPAGFFSDSGLTTPCNDGDGIYTWKDKSPGGRNSTQSSSTLRPLAKSVSGRWVARSDGVDDRIFGLSGLTGNPDITVCMAVNASTDNGEDRFYFALGTSLSAAQEYGVSRKTNLWTIRNPFNDQAGTVVWSAGAVVLTLQYTAATKTPSLRVNKVATTGLVAYAGNLSLGDRLTIGSNATGGSYSQQDTAGVVACNSVLSGSGLANLETYMGNLVGLSL